MKKRTASKKATKKLPPGFAELSEQIGFIIENMATKDELHGLEAKFERKFDALDEKFTKKFREVIVSNDKIATRLEHMEMEDANLHARLDRQEDWSKVFAGRLGVTLDY